MVVVVAVLKALVALVDAVVLAVAVVLELAVAVVETVPIAGDRRDGKYDPDSKEAAAPSAGAPVKF